MSILPAVSVRNPGRLGVCGGVVWPDNGGLPIPYPHADHRPGRHWENAKTPWKRIAWLAERRRSTSHTFLLILSVAAIVLAIGRAGGSVIPAASNQIADSSASAYLISNVVLETRGPAAYNTGEPETPAAIAAQTTAADAATPTPAPAAYFAHQVAEGETLNSIAASYGVSTDYLIWNNPEIGADPDSLLIGEELLVPGTEGIVYDVRLGDTINDIASIYGIDPGSILAFEGNELASPDLITEGMVLMLPGAVPPPPPVPVEVPVEEPVAEPVEAPVVPSLPVAVAVIPEPEPARAAPVPAAVPVPAPAPAPAPTVYTPSVGYIWPVAGPVWSAFGPRWGSFHSGIDIGAGYGASIAAAASGQVILATYRDNGYGNYIIIRHDDGSETLYAHLSEMYVSLGQYVSQGAAIGAVGCTGWCTGPHLHFEVHVGGSAVNPVYYLP
jgi:murein DD-endopeptidase MepM/ murein hydrolase activator NlpD